MYNCEFRIATSHCPNYLSSRGCKRLCNAEAVGCSDTSLTQGHAMTGFNRYDCRLGSACPVHLSVLRHYEASISCSCVLGPRFAYFEAKGMHGATIRALGVLM
jgi:hypothetical protein